MVEQTKSNVTLNNKEYILMDVITTTVKGKDGKDKNTFHEVFVLASKKSVKQYCEDVDIMLGCDYYENGSIVKGTENYYLPFNEGLRRLYRGY